MKNLKQIIALAALTAFSHSAFAVSGTNTVGVIPDGNVNGIRSIINIVNSGITAITDVQVVLHSQSSSGGFNGDLYAYLMHGNDIAILLNRVGKNAGGAALTGLTASGEVLPPGSASTAGYNNNGFGGALADGLRLSDGGANDVHFYNNNHGAMFTPGGQLKGTWKPDGRAIDPNSSGSTFDNALRNATFSSFTTKSADGAWTLFVADMSSDVNGAVNQIDFWDLEITGVPEPVDYALMAFGGIFAAVQGVRYMKKRKVVA